MTDKNKEIVINCTEEEINIALLEDKQLMELSREERKEGFCVGDIFLGKVHKTMSGLNAAFVNIGHEKDAFLHYLDLGENFHSYVRLTETAMKRRIFSFGDFPRQKELPKEGHINDVLTQGQQILVQVSKEAISTKGPRLTADLSLTGRHVVLLPFEKHISVSQKIRSAEERNRLKAIVKEKLPRNFGVIIRTAAKGKNEEEIANDIANLMEKWNAILERLQNATAPALIMSEESRAATILRDLLNDSFSNIYIDNKGLYQDIREYIRQIAPEKEKIVKHYRGSEPIFDNFEITRQIKGLFGKIVPFKRKSYMVIEHTEALHVIDINSGPRVKNADSQEDIAMEVNSNAVESIARQLRLRDMGGIIVIDFIDLHKSENKTKLYNLMKEAMAGDRARHNILPLTKFGLMQITRQRVRPVTKVTNGEVCPTCRGTGKITSSLLFDNDIESQIRQIVREQHCKYLVIKVHPYVASYLHQGIFSIRFKWMLRYKCRIKIVANESIGYVDAKYYDRHGKMLTTQSLTNYEGYLEDSADEGEQPNG